MNLPRTSLIALALLLGFDVGCSDTNGLISDKPDRVPGVVSLSLQSGASDLSCDRLVAKDDDQNILIDADVSAVAIVDGNGSVHTTLPVGTHHLTATLECVGGDGTAVELPGTDADVTVVPGVAWAATFWFVLDVDMPSGSGLVSAGFCPAVMITKAPVSICAGVTSVSVGIGAAQPVDTAACPLGLQLSLDGATTEQTPQNGESQWTLTIAAPQTTGDYMLVLGAIVDGTHTLPTGDQLPLAVVDCGVPTPPPVTACELTDTGDVAVVGCPQLNGDGTMLSYLVGVFSTGPAVMGNFRFETDPSITAFSATPDATLVDMGLGDSGSFMTATPADGVFTALVTPEILSGETLDPIAFGATWFTVDMTLTAQTPATLPLAVSGTITTLVDGSTIDVPFNTTTTFDLDAL